MPDGLSYLLSAPGRQKFVTILENEEASFHHKTYLNILLKSFSDWNKFKYGKELERRALHAVLFSTRKEDVSPQDSFWDEKDFHVYENFELEVDSLFKDITENVKRHATSTVEGTSIPHVLLIDDFAIFSLLGGGTKAGAFMKRCCSLFDRIYVFANKNALTPQGTSKLYELSTAVGMLSVPLEERDSGAMKDRPITCDLLKLREDRGLYHEQTKFRIRHGTVEEIKEEKGEGAVAGSVSSQDDVLKNLTTFKLTVEDKEKASRSKLYLPYFDAQKIDVEETEDLDYDDEDEEV